MDKPVFKLEKTEFIENGIGRLSLYTHKKSGGRVVCVDNEDNNSVFSLCFNTIPTDNSGIPHILEHCVLCGSEKYPFKDPFDMLYRGTINTYLNAITFPYGTIYPVASVSGNDLWLMAKVYCDGVFNPLVLSDKGIFLQEGVFFDGEKLNGVVYNEMTGFFDVMQNALEQSLKENFIDFCSAGLPQDIPKADYNRLIDYHNKYYTPQNCVAYVYGNVDKEKYLALLDKYFSRYNKNENAVVKTLGFKCGCGDVEKIYTSKKQKMSVGIIPLCPQKDFITAHAFAIIVECMKNNGFEIDIDDTTPFLYARAVSENLSGAELRNAVFRTAENLVISDYDIKKLRFFIVDGDFGYKPRGLFYNLKLLAGNLDFGSLDFDNIFKQVSAMDLKEMAVNAFYKKGFYGENVYKEKEMPTTSYTVTDLKPLEKYRLKADKGTMDFTAIQDIKISDIEVNINGRTAFVPTANKEIIYINLAFRLAMPKEHIADTKQLQGIENSAFLDIGEPCFTIQKGFFAEDWQIVQAELNGIFKTNCKKNTDAKITLEKNPQYFTDLLALSGIENTYAVINNAVGLPFAENYCNNVQNLVFTKENMLMAFCCHTDNIAICKMLADGLCLYDGENSDIPKFELKPKNEVIQTAAFALNTLSAAIKAPDAEIGEKLVVCEIIKKYLWENVRNYGAYGCDCYLTANGTICMNVFKAPDFDYAKKAFENAVDFVKNLPLSYDINQSKRVCLNKLAKPMKANELTVFALKKMYGCMCDFTEIKQSIISVEINDLKRKFCAVEISFAGLSNAERYKAYNGVSINTTNIKLF